MKRRTTTAKINEVLTSNLLTVTKVEVYHKTSRITGLIEAKSFLEDLQFLCEANVFMDCVGWHYEKDYKSGLYILEAGRTDAYSENVITVHMRVRDSVSDEQVKKALFFIEEDQGY